MRPRHHIRRRLRHQRLAEFALLLARDGEADAKTVARPRRYHAVGGIGRLLDPPGRQRVSVTQAWIAKALLQRLVDQPRQRHGECADLVDGKPDGRRVAGGIDKTQRNGAAIGCDLAGREGLSVDLHREAPDNYSLYPFDYIDAADGVQPAFGCLMRDRALVSGLKSGYTNKY